MFIFWSTAISLSVFLFSLQLGMCTRILRVVVTYAVVVASLSFYVFPCLPVSTNEAVLSVCVSLARFVFFFFSSSPLPLNFPTEFCFYILSLSPSGRLSAMVAVFRFGRRLHEKWEESRRRVTREGWIWRERLFVLPGELPGLRVVRVSLFWRASVSFQRAIFSKRFLSETHPRRSTFGTISQFRFSQ
jgi:hypothetical protein